jgi:hypothetical protein
LYRPVATQVKRHARHGIIGANGRDTPDPMNQMRQWLEINLPGLFRHPETTVTIDIAGVELTVRDWEGSNVLAIVPKEILDDDYKLTAIDFRPGDVVIDIGANIGIVGL